MAEEPLWLKAKKLKPQYIKQEASLAKGEAASKQLNSGRKWFSKRDVKRHGYLIEARSVEYHKNGEPVKTYSMAADELQKLEKDAFFHNALPAMQINFAKTGGRFIVTRLQDWEADQNLLNSLEGQIEDLQKQVLEIENRLRLFSAEEDDD